MGCSCAKHNLIDNEFKVTEENNKEQTDNSEILNNQNIQNEKLKSIQIINNKNIEDNNKEILLKSNIIVQKEEKEESKQKNDEINNINNINIKQIKESDYLSKNIYNKKIFELINKIRQNPSEYSKYVLESIKYINIENKEELNEITDMKEIKQIIVFKKKVKIRLNKGEESFLEAARYLQNLSPMEPLIFNENIVVPIFDSENINYNNIIKNKNINLFFKGNIKNPEIALLLMIVDDNASSEKKKRNALLNNDFKYIGIDSKFIDNKFLAHFSFSKG